MLQPGGVSGRRGAVFFLTVPGGAGAELGTTDPLGCRHISIHFWFENISWTLPYCCSFLCDCYPCEKSFVVLLADSWETEKRNVCLATSTELLWILFYSIDPGLVWGGIKPPTIQFYFTSYSSFYYLEHLRNLPLLHARWRTKQNRRMSKWTGGKWALSWLGGVGVLLPLLLCAGPALPSLPQTQPLSRSHRNQSDTGVHCWMGNLFLRYFPVFTTPGRMGVLTIFLQREWGHSFRAIYWNRHQVVYRSLVLLPKDLIPKSSLQKWWLPPTKTVLQKE